jgi:sarcosine oxidase
VTSSAPAAERRADIVVVGAGITGLATAVALRSRGLDVRCLEAGAPGAAQSAGWGRIHRHAHDDDRLVALAAEATRGWRRWETESGQRLLGEEGVLVAGGDALEATAARFAAARVASLRRDGARPLLDADVPTLVDVAGGSLRAARVVRLLVARLGDALVHRQVLSVEALDGAARVVTGDARWLAGRVVVCTGADTAALAGSVGLLVPLQVAEHVRVAFPVRRGAPPLPCLLDRSGRFGERCYALPLGSRREYAVGLHVEAGTSHDEAIARTAAYVARALPWLEPTAVAIRVCRSSSLEGDGDAFGVWAVGPVLVVAGGNVFKFAPVLGELVADVALGIRDEAEVRFGAATAVRLTASAV